jgi:hypothetical protein
MPEEHEPDHDPQDREPPSLHPSYFHAFSPIFFL